MKSCFVIMPFEPTLDSYYEHIIKPTLEGLDYFTTRSDEIYGIKPIIEDIIEGIENADILIADVTGKNPNVNYELGYAHALNKDVIIISQSLTDIPFDYRHKRAILYDVTKVDWQENLAEGIIKTVETLATRLRPETPNKIKDYQVSYSSVPSRATLTYENMFVKLSARAGSISEYMIDSVIEIIDEITQIPLDNDEFISLRGAWFDDKYGNISFYIDYVSDKRRTPSYNEDDIKELFHDGYAYYNGQLIYIDAKCIIAYFSSDNFFENADEYYVRVP